MKVPKKRNHARRHEAKKSCVREGEFHFELDGLAVDCYPVSEADFERFMKMKKSMKMLKPGEVPENGVWYRGC